MALKNLLVVVDAGPGAGAALAAAALLAARHDAHLTGLFVTAPPTLPGYIAPEIGDGFVQALRQRALEEAAAARADFEQRMTRAGLASRSEWRRLDGDPTEAAGIAGRYADLIVLGAGAGPVRGVRTDDLLFSCGRPVLLVPAGAAVASLGERVVVAWNAGREATRAVNDALPILERAEAVTVLAVNPAPGQSGLGDEPGADIALHLARHGIAAEAAQRSARGEVGPILLRAAAELDADLLVMGAYGRSRLREFVLGGATRYILDHSSVPVLLSH